MKYRICILGNAGSGKSTLAKALGKTLGLPVFHLDREMLRDNYVRIPLGEQIQKHQAIVSGSSWIIDGNYQRLFLAERVNRATLVIYLNVSRFKTIPRVLLRIAQGGQDKKTIPDDAKPNSLSWQFLKWMSIYSRRKNMREISEICQAEKKDLLVIQNQPVEKMVAIIKNYLSDK